MTPDELRAAADRATELLDAATPGPWGFNPDERVLLDVGGVSEAIWVATDATDLAMVWAEDGTHDAALIAAAPDLLAVLAPAARQYADTQDEVQRLRTVLDGLLDAVDVDELRLMEQQLLRYGHPGGFALGEIADAAAAARGEGTDQDTHEERKWAPNQPPMPKGNELTWSDIQRSAAARGEG